MKKQEKITGVIQVVSNGTGYLPSESFTEDIEIDHELLNTALNRDTVEVEIIKKTDRPYGKVTKVLERAQTRFVGVAEKEKGKWFLTPDDFKMYRDIHIVSGTPVEGHKLLVELTKWDDQEKNPEGMLVQDLGKVGDHDVEMKAIVLAKGFDIDFPQDVVKETKHITETMWPISEKEIEKRRDMRGTTTLTIDPEDAKDFDDALSIKKVEDKYEIGIHIADVSHYVKEGSALDKEARKRGFSVYLVDRTIPMLPLELSTDICSLNPNEDRLAFSAIFTLDENGKVHDEWFGKTIIHSNRRYSYEEAEQTIDNQKGDYVEELTLLRDLARKLRAKKVENGAINFETDEMQFILDEKGVPTKIYKKEHLETHKLIEDYMLLANKRVAEFVFRAYSKQEKTERPGKADKTPSHPFLYRVHDLPDPEKIQNLSLMLRALGYTDVKLKGTDVTSHDINRVLKMVEGKPEEEFIKTAAIRSMAKAAYSTKNVGHFGLAFMYYAHFTSPIRRYADLMVHRVLQKELTGNHVSEKEAGTYQEIAMQVSENEIAAAEAERDSIKYKQVEYMLNHIGETMDATISGVVEYGLYVRDNATHAEGLLHISNLGEDYFEYDEKTYSLVGEKTKKRYRLGDPIKVKLESADMDKRQLNFALPEEKSK